MQPRPTRFLLLPACAIVLVGLATAAPMPSRQQPVPAAKALTISLRWIDSGKDGHEYRSRTGERQGLGALVDDAGNQDDFEQLVAGVVERAEAVAADTTARERAVALLLLCASSPWRLDADRATQQIMARAMSRLVTTPSLPWCVRGPVLVATARLAPPEQLEWLLEGQVRIRDVLRVRRAGHHHPDEEMVAAILEYFDALESAAQPALPLVNEMLAADGVPAECWVPCVRLYTKLAGSNEPGPAADAFARLYRLLDEQPVHASEIHVAMASVASHCPDLLAEPAGSKTLLAMLDQLADGLKMPDRLSAVPLLTVIMLTKHAREIADVRSEALRAVLLPKCDALMQSCLHWNVQAVRDAAIAWQAVRKP